MDDRDYLPRYCPKWGEIFDARETTCPDCGTRWPRTLPLNRVESYTLLLTEIAELYRARAISFATYDELRDIYEQRLRLERPPRRARQTPPPVIPRPAAPP